MNWENLLKKEFGEIILETKKINENGMIILDVKINSHDSKIVEKYTYLINNFIDRKVNTNLDFDYLSVSSAGLKIDYKIDELDKLINEYVEIYLNKSLNKKDLFIGQLLQNEENSILLKWNDKGQFKKQVITKDLISKIKKHIKI
ncbi:hypothetical protein MM26B8_04810 [Mycoplasmopsis meleagridis]|uniref:Ribosome maturation factor RimP N-terminal domain-containing protein n=1 Tax=Mycoplasmopsis meleagridis ATCC 25294 TaxID=1264554 RepID=A0A0F5H064_9BACT|nr:hypothetical protein [Mycoplasmopsis meleagridis]KKB26711.1 hypothetical protein MMELEA_00930 [Mycoplasmopsis meleagridis ATCC 25294]OAD18173.1 hypothetical protein MM26B8_04810 [Mycoplasmopsis meleagridis]VEU77244.1 Uncharacterised protein [Mycoplasmopsis meleagridis]